MSPQEQAAARARFIALLDDFFAATARKDSPQLPAQHPTEKSNDDLHRHIFA
jgi:hypothetical protein